MKRFSHIPELYESISRIQVATFAARLEVMKRFEIPPKKDLLEEMEFIEEEIHLQQQENKNLMDQLMSIKAAFEEGLRLLEDEWMETIENEARSALNHLCKEVVPKLVVGEISAAKKLTEEILPGKFAQGSLLWMYYEEREKLVLDWKETEKRMLEIIDKGLEKVGDMQKHVLNLKSIHHCALYGFTQDEMDDAWGVFNRFQDYLYEPKRLSS